MDQAKILEQCFLNVHTRHVQIVSALRLSRQRYRFEASTLKTVDATTGVVKNVNPISRQVRNARHHQFSRLEGKTPVEVYNEVKLHMVIKL